MADPLEDLQSAVERGEGINFVPCVKWVPRGVAKSEPDKVRNCILTQLVKQIINCLQVIVVDCRTDSENYLKF